MAVNDNAVTDDANDSGAGIRRLIVADDAHESRLTPPTALNDAPLAGGTNGDLSPELASEVRRLLAAILVADYRADVARVAGATVVRPEGHNRA